jgi:hypothetical protein
MRVAFRLPTSVLIALLFLKHKEYNVSQRLRMDGLENLRTHAQLTQTQEGREDHRGTQKW